MIKNALLSLKKNIGKTILLFVIIVVITNLVIAGLSIQSATKKSMDQIRSSLGNDVTLSVDFRNMMKNRKPSEAVSNETSLTTTMADSLKDLKYVKNYNYQISTSANSNSISAVETASDNSNNQQDTNVDKTKIFDKPFHTLWKKVLKGVFKDQKYGFNVAKTKKVYQVFNPIDQQ